MGFKIRLAVFVGLLFLSCIHFNLSAQVHETAFSDHHCLLNPNALSLGIASPYSFELDEPGINIRLDYHITENFNVGPEYTYLNNGEEELWDVDFVFQYIFETKIIGIYPIAGITYSEIKSPIREQDWGGKFGAGLHRNFKHFSAFIEYDHISGDLEDDFITLGIFYQFHFKLKEHGTDS